MCSSDLVTARAETPSGWSVGSVDGGQHDAQGRQVVRRRVRTWDRLGFDRARDDQPGAELGEQRRIYGWIDPGALPIGDIYEQADAELAAAKGAA